MKRALSAYYVIIYFMKTQCSYKSKIITFIIILTIFQNLTISPAAEKLTTHNIEHSINYFSNTNVKILLHKNISVNCFISRYSLFVVLRLKSDYTFNEILLDCFELLISFNLMYIIAYTFFQANNGFKSNNG